jgi:predicted MFS family arabinose efflux permease
MASAFALTLAYLGEHTNASDSTSAFAAYITGNVASNLVGRFVSATVAEQFGLVTNFYFFALLNIAGAVLVYLTIKETPRARCLGATRPSFAAWVMHVKNPRLLASFGVAFCILFAFIGTFTYVNFVLVQAPLALGMMALGLVYFVFLPSIVTTPLAGRTVKALNTRPTMWLSLGVATAGLPLMLVPSLLVVLTGMVLIGVGTFFAQATATSYVSRIATSDRGAASGIYLACYFSGGLIGSLFLGVLFDNFGWHLTVICIGASLAVAAILTSQMREERHWLSTV